MGKKTRTLSLVRNNSGQTVVEYILLLAVVVAIASAVFQRFNLGPNSTFFNELRNQMTYSYCNPAPVPYVGNTEGCKRDYNALISSYEVGRFFIPADAYP